jgi:uncharacterized protein YjbI with pentapeptide repeats
MTQKNSIKDRVPVSKIIKERRIDRDELVRLSETKEPHWLVNCDLAKTNASGLQLTGWVFEGCDIKGANFMSANLETTLWQKSRGGDVILRAANMPDSHFEACDFNNSNFEGTTLADCSFDRCKLIGSNFAGAKTLNLTFEKSLLGGATLKGVSFRNKRINGVHFDYAILQECDFREAILIDCNFHDADIIKCKFVDADLRQSNIGSIKLMHVRLIKGAKISGSQAADLLADVGLEVL